MLVIASKCPFPFFLPSSWTSYTTCLSDSHWSPRSSALRKSLWSQGGTTVSTHQQDCVLPLFPSTSLIPLSISSVNLLDLLWLLFFFAPHHIPGMISYTAPGKKHISFALKLTLTPMDPVGMPQGWRDGPSPLPLLWSAKQQEPDAETIHYPAWLKTRLLKGTRF